MDKNEYSGLLRSENGDGMKLMSDDVFGAPKAARPSAPAPEPRQRPAARAAEKPAPAPAPAPARTPAAKPAPKTKTKPLPWITSMFLAVALTLSLFTAVRPDRAYSANENRSLRQRPALTFSGLLDGSYFSDLSAYFSDQFGGREMWMGLDLIEKQATGRRDNGGVYLGSRGQLYLIPETPDDEAVSRNLAAVNAFASRHTDLNCYMAVVPNALTVQPANLPANAPVPDQAAFLSQISNTLRGVTFVDVTPALTSHADEYIYYLTDHHWTSLGAQYAFLELDEAMSLGASAVTYQVETVADSFEGTLASKSGRHTVKDSVEIYVPDTDVKYYVTYADTMEKAPSVYVKSALAGKDAYTVFFGGNHPRVDVSSTAETGRRLLLFKDSYANCLVQFLWPYFEEIIMIDPRYYYDNADDLMRQEGVTDVLFLYNADTFGTDTSLYAVLG